MLDRIITYSFYALFFLTPLFWTSYNHELFEFNKMLLTYGLTILIVGAWIYKMVDKRDFIFKKTPLDIPLVLFLGANILSTIFSIDTHTSIWGYYSRLNGGLLSTISYLLLYWAFVSNFPKEKISTLFKFAFASGLIISIWGIMEHFGVSPSCILLRGEFNASCWVQDVQARVFATLGQPNWMAAYLAMLIFPALYFFLTAKTQVLKTTYYLLLTTLYLAFTFTYSRGPTLGLLGGIVVFLVLSSRRMSESNNKQSKLINWTAFAGMTKKIILILSLFLLINLLFGSALTSFRLVSKFAAPIRPGISLAPQSGTQLETGGTESGQIRFIVWNGALDIFKHYPIFGSGVETFAYSYYQFRPISHNLTSEWDFLYNKAHNEYLNYLATTGIVGFSTYIIVILTFIIWCIKSYVLSIKGKDKTPSIYSLILIPTLLASYVSYLIYNFFLFSVVIIAIFFYLFPAIAFVATNSLKPMSFPKFITSHFSLLTFIYRKPLYTKIAKVIVAILTLCMLLYLILLWRADTLFTMGEKANDEGSPGIAYNKITKAISLNNMEPLFKSELAYSAASAAVALGEDDASLSAELKNESVAYLEKVLKENPNNISFWRTAIRTYFELSYLDKKYFDKTMQALDKAIALAPTDPKLYYNKGLILLSDGKKQQAIENFKKALELKPNYLEAGAKLEEATESGK